MSNIYPVTVTGYKFYSQLDADEAVQHCADYYNTPNWTQCWQANYNTPTFWFILSDESLVPVLGQAITFEYNQLSPAVDLQNEIINS